MDAATGLLYVGNGQYYDPATGRFLTRGVNPDSTNPYTPWNPIGAVVGPLGLIALFSGRKKKGSKAGTFLVLLLVLGSVGMTLSACGGNPAPTTGTPPATPIPTQTPVDMGPGTATESGASDPGSATQIPCLPPCLPTPTSTSTPMPTPTNTPTPDLMYLTTTGNLLKVEFERLKKETTKWFYTKNGTFGLREMITVVLQAELYFIGNASDEVTNKLEVAAVSWFYSNCNANNNNQCTPSENSILSWLSRMDSAQGLFNGGDPQDYGDATWKKTQRIADLILGNHPATWEELDGNTPVHWANWSYYNAKLGFVPDSSYIVFPIGSNPKDTNALYLVSTNEEQRLITLCESRYKDRSCSLNGK